MIYQLPEIVRMVRTAMARGASTPPLLRCRDPDELPLDALIISKIEQGAVKAYHEAGADRLFEARRDFSTRGVCWHPPADGTWSGHVVLPGDFLKLCVFCMSDWSGAVFEAVDCRSPAYMLTRSPYSALRGSPVRPVVAIADMPEGRVLEFHSCTSDSQWIAQASYCAVPRVDSSGGIDIAGSMIHDVIDSIANLVKSDK